MQILKDFSKKAPIDTIESWRKLCPPAHQSQWVDGRSAFESAKFWLNPYNQQQVQTILAKSFGGIIFQEAAPEYKTPFDKNGGNDRIHDLLIKAADSAGELLIGVECKVDEPFGDVIAKSFIEANARLLDNPASKALNRILELHENFPLRNSDMFWGLRYQLVYAIAGLANFAIQENVSRVLFLTLTFKTEKYDERKAQKNEMALDNLAYFLTESKSKALQNGDVQGPIVFDKGLYKDVNIYICKLQVNT